MRGNSYGSHSTSSEIQLHPRQSTLHPNYPTLLDDFTPLQPAKLRMFDHHTFNELIRQKLRSQLDMVSGCGLSAKLVIGNIEYLVVDKGIQYVTIKPQPVSIDGFDIEGGSEMESKLNEILDEIIDSILIVFDDIL